VSLVVIIAAEFVAAKAGIGYLIWFSWSTLVTEEMFVGLMVIAALGMAFTEGLKRLERPIIPWEREVLPEQRDRRTPDEAL
jgi:ABC-type nitrate/sulfonate/bicarbonate transport system permease component